MSNSVPARKTNISLIKIFSWVVAFPITILLLIYNLRRIIFSLTILFPRKNNGNPASTPEDWALPSVLILVPCRDEEGMVPGLCTALERLNYPPEKIHIVLIDDGSRDQTGALFKKCAHDKSGWHALSLSQNMGKAGALNVALDRFPSGELIFVYDADHRPEPDSLRQAVRYFEDKRVAGVSGRTIPTNGNASPSAYYSTIENMVHQMITMRAKDRLSLAPALLGSNCGYRRTALKTCDGFRPGAFLEDSDLTLAFYQRGYCIRFAEDAVAYHQVPETVSGYLNQHIRWGRGFNKVSQDHIQGILKNHQLKLPLRIELALFSTGYLDRTALVGALCLAGLQRYSNNLFFFPIWIIYLALITPLIQIIMLLTEQHSPLLMWRNLPWVPIFFLLDIYAAMRGFIETLVNRPQVWSKTKRV